jgi:hypothetical protein
LLEQNSAAAEYKSKVDTMISDLKKQVSEQTEQLQKAGQRENELQLQLQNTKANVSELVPIL